MERRSTTAHRSEISTSLGDLVLLDYDFDAFLKVGPALECNGSLVIDVVSIASWLLHADSAAPQYTEIDSPQYGNSTLE